MKHTMRIILAFAVLLAGSTEGWAQGTQLKLQSAFDAAKIRVTFYQSATEPTAAFTDAPGAPIASDDPGVNPGVYVVMKVEPQAGYWTNEALLFSRESTDAIQGGGTARRRAPGIDLGNQVHRLGTDHKGNGEGWYYYQIPATHTVAAGYKYSGIDGLAVPQFDLSAATLNPASAGTTPTTSAITVTATAAGGWSATFTIDKTSYTYSGVAQSPTISPVSIQVKKGTDNAVTFTTTDNQITLPVAAVAPSTLTGGKSVNAGNYTATLTNVAKGIFTGTKAIPFTIGTKALTITADAKSKTYGDADPTLTYTQTGLVAGDALTGNLTRVAGEAIGNYAITQGTLAASANYTVTYVGANLTINPVAAVTVTITGHNNTAVYDGAAHTVNGYDVSISNPLYTTADFTFTGTATATRTATGMTSMGLAPSQFTNTNPNFGTVTFNVTDGYQKITSPTDVVVTITGHSNTADYDGTAHTVNGYDVTISNPLYTTADFTFSGTATAARTDAGTTNMGLTAAQFTNTNTNFGSVTFSIIDGYQTISPIAATVTITGHNNTTTYDGTAHSVSGYDVSFSNALYQASNISFTGTATATRTEEGTTMMGLTAAQFSNTSANFAPVTFTVIDGYQRITSVTDVVVTITGHSNTADYDGTAHTVSGYDVEISNPLYTTADFSFTGTATATRTDAGTTNMGLAASQFTNNNGSFTSVTFNVTDGHQTISKITATVTINGHSNTAVYDGTAHTVTGYDVSISNNLYKETDFTFAGTASTNRTDQGTAYMGLAADQFTNTNGNFSTVTFTVIDGYQTITPATLTITADAKSKTYGEADPALTYTQSGLVAGDAITGALTRVAGEDAGTYAITQGTLAASANYTVTYIGANLTINKAAGSISYAETSISKTFGDAAFTNPLTFTGDGTVTYASDNAAVATVNATTGEVTITGNGNATITATATDGTNYTYATPTATYTIAVGTADMTATITATGYTGTYDKTAHGITVTAPDGATVTYGTTAGTYDQTTSPTFTNAGTYTVYYQVTKAAYTTVTGSATVVINRKTVTVSGITAHDKDYDGTTYATLILGNATFGGLIAGDILTVTAIGTFEDAEVGDNKMVYIGGLTLGGTSVGNYILAAAGNQTTTIASILSVGTIDRKHSGIEVRRNDTNALVDNDAYLTLMTDGTLRIDHVDILKPADATAANPVSVSIWIPKTLTDYDGTTGNTYGVGNDIIITDANVPVTDVYMPDTEEMISVSAHAFRLNPTESKTAFIHTPLPLLDDYALCNGLKAEYEAGKVMTTVHPTTRYWTLSSGVDIVVPEHLRAYTCQADGMTAVVAIVITQTTATVEGSERTIVKANNGVMMGGDPGSYDLRAWPSADRPSGMTPPTGNDRSYKGNELEPAIVSTHFVPTEYYILYNNVFHELQPTDNTFVSPCKAVLRKSSAAMARSLSIGIDDEAAGIQSVTCDTDASDGKWYTLDGRKLDGQPTKKGLYIRNGAKVIIK